MRTSTPSTGDPFSSSLDDLDSVYTLVSTSSSRTASNLPGAGRVLGNLISSLGRILERLFSRFAEGMGMGPRAVARKIELHHSLCCVRGESANNRHPPSARQARKLRKDCQRLVGYLQSDVLSTQLEALVYISCLATMHLSLQQTFRDCNSVATLRAFFARLETAPYTAATREEFGRLRVSARRCIVCVDDNEINRLSRGFRQTIYTAGWVQYVEKLSVRAKSCENADYAFLACTYLNNWLFELEGRRRPFPERNTLEIVAALAAVVARMPRLLAWHVLDGLCCKLLESRGPFAYAGQGAALEAALQSDEARELLPLASRVADAHRQQLGRARSAVERVLRAHVPFAI